MNIKFYGYDIRETDWPQQQQLHIYQQHPQHNSTFVKETTATNCNQGMTKWAKTKSFMQHSHGVHSETYTVALYGWSY